MRPRIGSRPVDIDGAFPPCICQSAFADAWVAGLVRRGLGNYSGMEMHETVYRPSPKRVIGTAAVAVVVVAGVWVLLVQQRSNVLVVAVSLALGLVLGWSLFRRSVVIGRGVVRVHSPRSVRSFAPPSTVKAAGGIWFRVSTRVVLVGSDGSRVSMPLVIFRNSKALLDDMNRVLDAPRN